VLCGRQTNTPVFREPPLFLSKGNRTPRHSSPTYLYTLPNPWLGGEPHECLWAKSSARYAWFCFMFSLLFTGSQFRRKAKPPSPSDFAFSRISLTLFGRWSTYPDVLKSMRQPTLMLFSCRRRIFGLIRTTNIWLPLHLASIVLRLCPTHTFPQSDIHPVFGLCFIFECRQH